MTTANTATTLINTLDAERAFFRDFFGVGSQPGFGVQLRKVAAEALFADYQKETDAQRKKLLVINLHQQACLTFEDIAAVMLAIERKLSRNVDFLETYLLYKPGDAYIAKLISSKGDQEILETFGFGNKLQDLYKEHKIPREKLWEGRKNFLKHVKSVAKVQQERKTICNKSKHGAAILSLGGALLSGSGSPDVMSALSLTKDETSDPSNVINHWQTEGFRYSDVEVRFWLQVISDAPSLLKTLAFQYLLRFHPDLLEEWIEEMGRSQ